MNETTTIPTAALALACSVICFGICYAGALRAGFGELEKTFVVCLVLAAVSGIGAGLSVIWLLLG